MKKFLDNKSILITGGTGSFGKQFIETVLKKFKPKNFKIHNKWNPEICEEEYKNLDEKEANLFIFVDEEF